MKKPVSMAVAVAAVVVLVILACMSYHGSSTSESASERFRELVLSRLKVDFPNRGFRANPLDSDSILVDGYQLGLGNLRRKFEQSDRSDKSLETLVREHMALFASETNHAFRFPKSLEEARERLLPQIMPAAFAGDTNQVRIPIGGGLIAGIVADDNRAYLYMMWETLGKWSVSQEDVYRIALQNLELRSKGLKLQEFKRGGTTFIAAGAGDGYDAARIMLPGLKKLIGEKLGFPFNFGIPNRDFLICWSASVDEESRRFVNERLKEDFQKQPYPISCSVFQVAADGTITEQATIQPGASPNPGPPFR